MNRKPDVSSFDPLASKAQPQVPAQQNRASSARPRVPIQQHPPVVPLSGQQAQFLEQHGFSSGLQRALVNAKASSYLRIVVIDNSAAMNVRDSHRIGPNWENLPASRWEELNDSVAYHSQMAAMFGMQTRFALLNEPKVGPKYFTVGEPGKDPSSELQVVRQVMTQNQPAGPTLLTEELLKLRQYIASIAPTLPPQSTISIVLATQGIPNGGGPALVQALRGLEGLPVWVVVRLCTDDEQTADFYNSLDAQLNLPYDVLDDFYGEALEVFLRNPWLTYALPLHRFRELGFRIPVLDTIDERALTHQEVYQLCSLLFASLPDPTVDWRGFHQAVSACMAREKAHFNPVTRKTCPWINLHDLDKLYGRPIPSYPPQGVPQQPAYPSAQEPQRPPPGQQPYQAHAVPPHFQQSQQQQPHQPQGTRQPSPHYQQPQQAAQPQGSAQPSQIPVQPQSTSGTPSSTAIVKRGVTQWATLPPAHSTPRPIENLLGSVHTLFPPAFGIKQHAYFEKYKPFSADALSSGQAAVIKRAIRKMKFFLHPDKLPKDFDENQTQLCRAIWDAVADASEATTGS